MSEAPLIRAIQEQLRAGGYEDVPTPFRVAAVGFEFTAAMRGQGGRALDLILLIDTTTGDFGDRDADRIRQRVEALSRALDLTESRLVITVILAGAPLLGKIEALSETCRVLYVEALPIDYPANQSMTGRGIGWQIGFVFCFRFPSSSGRCRKRENAGCRAVDPNLTSNGVDQGVLDVLIEASKKGEGAVTAAIASVIGRALIIGGTSVKQHHPQRTRCHQLSEHSRARPRSA